MVAKDKLRDLEKGKNIQGDLGSYFYPLRFGLLHLLQEKNFTKDDSLNALKTMNKSIHDNLNVSATAKALIEYWYGGANLPNAFNGSFAFRIMSG